MKLRYSFGIIGLELYRSVSGKVSKSAEMPFTKLDRKSRIIEAIVCRSTVYEVVSEISVNWKKGKLRLGGMER